MLNCKFYNKNWFQRFAIIEFLLLPWMKTKIHHFVWWCIWHQICLVLGSFSFCFMVVICVFKDRSRCCVIAVNSQVIKVGCNCMFVGVEFDVVCIESYGVTIFQIV